MDIRISKHGESTVLCDTAIIPFTEGIEISEGLLYLDSDVEAMISYLVKDKIFTGKKEQIEKIIGRVDELSVKKKSEKNFLKEIKVIKREDFYMLSEDSILLAFTNIEKLSIKRVEILSKNGDYEEAIKNLYDSLHNLLEEENSTIFVEELNENGLGKVIMERIQKIVK